MSTPRDMTVTLTIDTSRITAAIKAASKAFDQFGEAMRKLTDVFNRNADDIRRWALIARRAQHGGNGTDAAKWPNLWQSAACSAWLHESCTSDQHDLDCTCTCHRKGRA